MGSDGVTFPGGTAGVTPAPPAPAPPPQRTGGAARALVPVAISQRGPGRRTMCAPCCADDDCSGCWSPTSATVTAPAACRLHFLVAGSPDVRVLEPLPRLTALAMDS